MLEPINSSVLLYDPHNERRTTLKRFISANHPCKAIGDISVAGELIASGQFDVLVTEFEGDDSFELISTAQFLAPDMALVMTTEAESSRFVVDLFRAGVSDVVLRPFDLDELETALTRAIAKAEIAKSRNRYYEGLEGQIVEGNSKLEQALEGIEKSYGVTLKALIQALETRDAETHGHSERVVTYSLRLAHEIGLDQEQRRDLELGALLHDIGKIGVPDAILRKPGKLDEREWEKMRLHPIQGHRILRNISFLEGASRVVLQHHERWDGKGYPNKLRGNEIDICARVFAIADAFDAMTSDRVYSRGMTFDEAYEELKKCAGSQFDPEIIEAFNLVPRTDWEILRSRSLKERHELFSFQTIIDELVYSQRHFEMVH